MLKIVALILKTKAQDSENRDNIMQSINKRHHIIKLIGKRPNIIDKTNGAIKRTVISSATARLWTIKLTVLYKK